MNTIKLILFDLDGTLVNTLEDLAVSTNVLMFSNFLRLVCIA